LKGSYGIDVIRRWAADKSARLLEIQKATGLGSLAVGGVGGGEKTGHGAESGHVHFLMKCQHLGQVEQCRTMLAADLTKVHEDFAREIRGSLVIKGFPASWSEKQMKFVFAPFGGLSSIHMEEDKAPADAADQSRIRLAYVKLRNETSIDKAVANLHQTKVGDGDLVEDCVVSCQRWRSRAWSDGSLLAGFFVDQLGNAKRPLDDQPGAEDRELYVQSLPLQDMNAQQLREYFEGFGEVEDMHLIKEASTDADTNDGYIRFKNHRDAARCIEALTPTNPQEADPTDLSGSWSESERVLQKKANCYRFSLLPELVGMDGSGLERLKEESKAQSIWVLAESLEQKDKHAPPSVSRQVQIVGRVADESGAKLFRECLQRAVESLHDKVADRLAKRKRKTEGATAAVTKADDKPRWKIEAPPPQTWGQHHPPPNFWGVHGRPPAPGMFGGPPPPGYHGAPIPTAQTGSAWGEPTGGAQKASVFEVASSRLKDGGRRREAKDRSRSRRRDRHTTGAAADDDDDKAGGDENNKDQKDRRRRRRHRSHRDRSGGEAPKAEP